jgi:hypothetical protein
MGGPFKAGIIDPTSNAQSDMTMNEDLFCVGHCVLPNGNVLLAGGTKLYDIDTSSCNGKWHGLESVYEFDISSQQFNKVSSMKHGRWYPTLVVLSDGKIGTFHGYDEYGDINKLVEIYDPGSRSWSLSFDPTNSTRTYCVGASSEGSCVGAGSPCYGGTNQGVAPDWGLYPRMHLMPSGFILVCGFSATTYLWNPKNGVWSFTGKTSSTYRHYGTSFLLPLNNTQSERGKVLLVGGSSSASTKATSVVEVLDFNASGSSTSPSIRKVGSLSYGRKFLLPVILPNGKVIVFGGSEQVMNNPRLIPEMFDPSTEQWSSLAPASVPRVYHGVALLLPDGSVWTAGSTKDRSSQELRTEIFKPDYYSSSNRPQISGTLTVGGYGETIVIPTQDASNIDSISLISLPNSTHHYDPTSRLVWLQVVSKSTDSITVSAPLNANLAPPGYYMIHILRSGIPSPAKIIAVPGQANPPSDTVAPTITISSPTDGSSVTGPSTGVTVNVSGTALDEAGGSGVQKVEVQFGTNGSFISATPKSAGDWSTWTASGTVNQEGPLAITARATDNAGNAKNATVTVTIAFTQSTGSFVSIYSVTGESSYASLTFDGTNNYYRAGEIVSANSSLIGESVKRVSVVLKKAGNPTGDITVVARNGNDDSISVQFGTIKGADLTTTDKTFTLTATSSHTFKANDKILVEWAGTGNTADQVNVKRKSTTNDFDGTNTYHIYYRNTSYISSTTRDLAGEWFKEVTT